MNDKEACILLNMVQGIGYVKVKAICESLGSPGKIFEKDIEGIKKLNCLNEKTINSIFEYQKNGKLTQELKLIEKASVKVTSFLDDDYPSQLKEISNPPLCLYSRGSLNCSYDNTLAVVGSRMLTTYGREVIESIIAQLSYAGWNIVSGLAYGTDAAVHRTVVNSNGVTIGVLGGGLMKFHPQEHLELAEQMIEKNGAVISEFPMEMPPTRQSFPMRNRIISGLSKGVLVIEAGNKSGSLITSNFALEQGRQVFAIPGRINSPQSKGCNALIKNGAKLVESVDDILDEFELLPGFKMIEKINNENLKLPNEVNNKITLSDDELKIISCIKNEEKSIDIISVETSIPLPTLLTSLMKLELKKQVSQLPGKRYKSKN